MQQGHMAQRSEDFVKALAHRQLMFWTVTTKRQLDRWEPLVAHRIRTEINREAFPDALIWEAEAEHHFLLVAAAHLLRAVDLAGLDIPVDETIRAETKEGRDLHEHWDENAPVFNVRPRTGKPPRRSGQSFATRNPDSGPYWWFGWNNHDGPMVLPNVPASALHDLVNRVEAVVGPGIRPFVPERQQSPWAGDDYGRDRWWPRPPS